jgi:ferredoxin-type protein NapG
MAGDKNMNSRRDALKKMFRDAGLLGLGGTIWGATATRLKASDLTLRPPGALNETDFVKACIRCGTCVESCPYDTLKLATLEDHSPTGMPFFKPRSVPCYMCPDVPCVPVCPSGALDITTIAKETEGLRGEEPDITKARMGIAVIDQEACLAYWGIQCDACYRACPLLDEAITLEYKRNERTGKHAFLEPVVHRNVCTGCGMCEHACVTEKAAIFILPREVATGKVGEHYIKGWKKSDEERLKAPEDKKQKKSSPEDILNDWETLFGDD